MKKITFGILPLTVGLLLTGCASHRAEPVYTELPVAVETTRPVVVLQEPPPPQVTESESHSGPIQVWVQGYWNNTHGKWIWMPGHWESRPHAGAIWVSGHWDKDLGSNEWTWTPGHWA